MKKTISERFVTDAMVRWLARHGWDRGMRVKGLRDKGVDIRVRHNRYPRYFLIETKGEGSALCDCAASFFRIERS